MRILFRVRKDWGANRIDYRTAPETDLCVLAFEGDRVTFEYEDRRLGLGDEGVPLLEALLSFVEISRRANPGSTVLWTTLYSHEDVSFRFDAEAVCIAFRDEELTVPIEVFRGAATSALTAFAACAVGEHPELRQNPTFQRLLAELDILLPTTGP